MPKKEIKKIPPEVQSHFAVLEPLINKPSELTSHLHSLIASDKDPFYLTKWLASYTRHYKKGILLQKLPSALLTTLCVYFKDKGSQDGDTLLRLHQCAFDVCLLTEDMKLYKIVDNIFGLSEDQAFLIERVKELLRERCHKSAYLVIDAFNLEEIFEPEEVLYPFLFLKMDNYVKNYLEKCPSKRIPFLIRLDNLASIPNGIVDFLRSIGVTDPRQISAHMDKKWLMKRISSFLDVYKIDIKICPNLYKHRVSGAMHYLCKRLFNESGLSYDAFEEMILDTLEDHKDVQIALLWKLVNKGAPEFKMAVRLAEQFKIPREYWPEPIMFAPSSPQNFYEFKWPLPCLNENPPEFLKLRLPASEVVMIDQSSKLLEAIKDITENYDVVGIDAEWKPNLGLSLEEKAALLQLAVWDTVYLVDVLALNKDGMFHVWDTLMREVICNKDIIKLGYGIANDLKVLVRTLNYESMWENYKHENVIDFCKFLDKLKSGFPDVYEEVETWHDDVPYIYTEDSKGLALLCRMVLGKPLSKFEQFSNWEKRPLRAAQIEYAALDAYCLLMAYEMFYPLLKRRKLDWKKVFDSKPVPKPKIPRPDLLYQPERAEGSVKKFRAVVDHHETVGTVRMLRHLGCDVITLEKGENHMTAVKIALAQNRVLITTKKNYDNAIWYLPKGQVYISSDATPYMELLDILFHYRLKFQETDCFSRCSLCNKDDYIKVARSELMKHLNACEAANSTTKEKVNRKDLTVFRCDITDTLGEVHKDHLVKLAPCNSEVSVFYLCSGCGKVYWDGSHLKRYKKCLEDIIDKKIGRWDQYKNELYEQGCLERSKNPMFCNR